MNHPNAYIKRYGTLMERAVTNALQVTSHETDMLAESAIKTYTAALDGDYKTMWEETDWMLLRANAEIYELKEKLRLKESELVKEKAEKQELKHWLKVVETFHGQRN